MEQPAPIAPPPGYGNVMPEDASFLVEGGPIDDGEHVDYSKRGAHFASQLPARINAVLLAVTDLNEKIAAAQTSAHCGGVGLDVVLIDATGGRAAVGPRSLKFGATVAVIHGARR